jgi:hypothetical protein
MGEIIQLHTIHLSCILCRTESFQRHRDQHSRAQCIYCGTDVDLNEKPKSHYPVRELPRTHAMVVSVDHVSDIRCCGPSPQLHIPLTKRHVMNASCKSCGQEYSVTEIRQKISHVSQDRKALPYQEACYA